MKWSKFWPTGIILGLFLFGAGGCRSDGTTPGPEGESSMAIQVSSSAFTEGSTIPKKYTCDNEDVSPALEWSGIPQGTKSLALIVDDPDAPMGTFVHWVLYDIPPDTTGLPEGMKGIGTQGKSSFGKQGYGGPCPPKGPAHRYYFKLYALDTTLDLEAGAAKAEVEKAMQGHILAQGEVMGKYGR